jgi:viologen exporter family transport system permease protein
VHLWFQQGLTMRRFWRKLRAILGAYYAWNLEYRAEILLWVLATVFPLIMMGVWVRASAGGQFSMGPKAFAQYFLAVYIVRQFTVVWVVWEFEYHVVEGKLSPYLLQPIDPGWRFLATHVAERAARLPFAVAVIALFLLLYPQALFVPRLTHALLAVVVIALAFLIRWLLQYTLGMLAFWVERASAVEHFVYLVYLFLSGLMAPLEVYPKAVRDVAMFTPFPYLVHFPARLLVGGEVDVARGLTTMLLWLTALFAVNRWLWRQGLKHYSAMGA